MYPIVSPSASILTSVKSSAAFHSIQNQLPFHHNFQSHFNNSGSPFVEGKSNPIVSDNNNNSRVCNPGNNFLTSPNNTQGSNSTTYQLHNSYVTQEMKSNNNTYPASFFNFQSGLPTNHHPHLTFPQNQGINNFY
jgi:hypothetical protein